MESNLLRVYIHFVWATKDRLPLLTSDIERDVHRYIAKVCEDDGCQVHAIGGTENHVHLLVSLCGTISTSQLMQHVKGGSLRFVSSKLKPEEWFAWQGHYAAFSLRRKDIARTVRYIQNQKQHHAEGSLWPEAERTHQEDTEAPREQ